MPFPTIRTFTTLIVVAPDVALIYSAASRSPLGIWVCGRLSSIAGPASTRCDRPRMPFRYCPVYDRASFATSSGAPTATISPPPSTTHLDFARCFAQDMLVAEPLFSGLSLAHRGSSRFGGRFVSYRHRVLSGEQRGEILASI